MDFEHLQERVRAERYIRSQRDAAERHVPGERLRRELRESATRDEERRLAAERHQVEPWPGTDDQGQ